MRACSARDGRFFRHLPKYRPPPATTRPHAGSTHGRSGTPGAVAAAAQAPQTTTAATLPRQRPRFRRVCCLAGCLISGRRGSDARAATTLRASPLSLSPFWVNLVPCRRARAARARRILARPLAPTEPRSACLAERQLHPAHCHSTGWRGRRGDDGGGGEAGDSGREREAMEEEEEKLISWAAAGRAAGVRSALFVRPLKRTTVAATITRASLTKPTARISMARPPPRLAARARLCTRPDGGRPRTRPTIWGAPRSSNKKASAV